MDARQTHICNHMAQGLTTALFTRTDNPFGMTNQKSSHCQSWLGFSSSKSNSLRSLGISFDISRMLMCLPTHDLEPNPKGTDFNPN